MLCQHIKIDKASRHSKEQKPYFRIFNHKIRGPLPLRPPIRLALFNAANDKEQTALRQLPTSGVTGLATLLHGSEVAQLIP
jgi:hypothetical protein